MTKTQVLQKAIEKAVGNGLKWGGYKILSFKVEIKKGYSPVYFETEEQYKIEEVDDFGDKTGRFEMCNNGAALSIESLLFNHDFARALWPPEPHYTSECPKCDAAYNWWSKEEALFMEIGAPPEYCGQDGTKLRKKVEYLDDIWKARLRNMVVEEDPLKYLEDNMPEAEA